MRDGRLRLGHLGSVVSPDGSMSTGTLPGVPVRVASCCVKLRASGHRSEESDLNEENDPRCLAANEVGATLAVSVCLDDFTNKNALILLAKDEILNCSFLLALAKGLPFFSILLTATGLPPLLLLVSWTSRKNMSSLLLAYSCSEQRSS